MTDPVVPEVHCADSAPVPAGWRAAYPRHRGSWTLAGPCGSWAAFEPESGAWVPVDPRLDRALPAMSQALVQGRLVAYRVGRRAVVATGHSFLKVVRPKRLPAIVEVHEMLAHRQVGLATPAVVATWSRGAVELSTVPGRSVHDLLRAGELTPQQATAIGRALAELHAMLPPPALGVRCADEPQQWVDTVRRADPDFANLITPMAAALPKSDPVVDAVVHGDLHDKNVRLVREHVGLIDLDGIAAGSGDDELANLGVHLRLRFLQAGRDAADADPLVDTLIGSYAEMRAIDSGRIAAAERHVWFRLACIYRFRRSRIPIVPTLLRRAVACDRQQ